MVGSEISIEFNLDELDAVDIGTFGMKIDCKHVHTLQNLYHALTGEELVLK